MKFQNCTTKEYHVPCKITQVCFRKVGCSVFISWSSAAFAPLSQRGSWDDESNKVKFSIMVHDDVIKWKHIPPYWPIVREIHRLPFYSPHKGQWRAALMLSLICTWTNRNNLVNNLYADDLRRHRAHYDVTEMTYIRYMWYCSPVGKDGISINSHDIKCIITHDVITLSLKFITSSWHLVDVNPLANKFGALGASQMFR